MKKYVILLSLLIMGINSVYGDDTVPRVNIFDSMVVEGWGTEIKVNFENLKYAGTYPVFFFWEGIEAGRDKIDDHEAIRWITERQRKLKFTNIALIGVFTRGDYSVVRKHYRNAGQIPQILEPEFQALKRLCRINQYNTLVITDPQGKVIESADNVFDTVRGHPDKNIVDHVIFNAEEKPWIEDTYEAFNDVPAVFEPVQELLKYGHFAQVYQIIEPYLASEVDGFRSTADNALARIQAYQKALIADIKALNAENDNMEIYRLAYQAYGKWKNIECSFTAILKKILVSQQKKIETKVFARVRKIFVTGLKLYEAGKIEHARKYFQNTAASEGPGYYVKRARAILQLISTD